MGDGVSSGTRPGARKMGRAPARRDWAHLEAERELVTAPMMRWMLPWQMRPARRVDGGGGAGVDVEPVVGTAIERC